MDDAWVVPAAGGSVLRVHVRPAASRPGVTGLHGGALAVRVGAPPVGGAANREVLEVLATALGVATAALEVSSGAQGRTKRIRVHGLSPAIIAAKLSPLLRV